MRHKAATALVDFLLVRQQLVHKQMSCLYSSYRYFNYVIQNLPQLQNLTQQQLEQIIERFDSREEVNQGDVILREGQHIEKLYVVKNGDLEISQAGDKPSTSSMNFIAEAGGFNYFGERVLDGINPSPVTITVRSQSAQILTLRRRCASLCENGLEASNEWLLFVWHVYLSAV